MLLLTLQSLTIAQDAPNRLSSTKTSQRAVHELTNSQPSEAKGFVYRKNQASPTDHSCPITNRIAYVLE